MVGGLLVLPACGDSSDTSSGATTSSATSGAGGATSSTSDATTTTGTGGSGTGGEGGSIPDPTCSDSLKNQDETDVDCGGASCDACDDGEGCGDAADCVSGVCTAGVCIAPGCGDGVIQGSEECDDGGESATCDDDCTTASCGDGLTNVTADEACDGDGAGTGGETATCNLDCTAASCGDGLVNAAAGEACDGDGAGTGGETATCNVDCTAASCGDGVVNAAAGEACDGDGAGTGGETATCNTNCAVAACGDGLVNVTAGEACDGDGAGTGGETAACDADCTAATCGDGSVNVSAGETCDGDGMGTGGQTASCDSDCSAPSCGDGVLNTMAGEVCDGAALPAGVTCVGDGYLGGALSCGAACLLDHSTCTHSETLQNYTGLCDTDLGCSDPVGTSGNPNELVECFQSSFSGSFGVTQVTYQIGASIPAPSSLFAELYAWDGVSAPGAIVASQPLSGADLTTGPHTVPLGLPAGMSNFCIGINSYDLLDGFRLVASSTAGPAVSWVQAPTCGITPFAPISLVAAVSNWCITATADKPVESLVINEIDYDQVGADSGEFVEIFNPTVTPVSLAGMALVLMNGSTSAEYLRVDLSSGGTVQPGQYLVVASGSVTVAAGAIVVPFAGAQDNVQNGAPDALAIVHTTKGRVIDALSYEGSVIAGDIVGLGPTNFVEGTAAGVSDSNSVVGSLSRLPNGRDTNDAAADWVFSSMPTAGSANAP